MYINGCSVRGFRPSRCADRELIEEDEERDRLANLALYSLRAQAGLPLFDPPGREPVLEKKRVG